MSSYLTSVSQATDLWHCRLVDDGEGNMVCEEPYEDIPPNIIKTGELDGNNIYLSVKPIGQGTILGGWYHDGSIAMPVDPVYDALVPVGNVAGVATGDISYSGYQGHAIRHRQEAVGLPQYPSDNQPCVLRITRDTNVEDKWGFYVESLSDDPARNMEIRRIGIEDGVGDPYTVNFNLVEMNDGTEDDPILVTRYVAIPPDGLRTADPRILTFTLMLQEATEGTWYLTDLEEGATQTRLFWAADLPGDGE